MRIQKSLQGLKGEDVTKKCPECGSKDIAREKDELYCKKCGYVIE